MTVIVGGIPKNGELPDDSSENRTSGGGRAREAPRLRLDPTGMKIAVAQTHPRVTRRTSPGAGEIARAGLEAKA